MITNKQKTSAKRKLTIVRKSVVATHLSAQVNNYEIHIRAAYDPIALSTSVDPELSDITTTRLDLTIVVADSEGIQNSLRIPVFLKALGS